VRLGGNEQASTFTFNQPPSGEGEGEGESAVGTGAGGNETTTTTETTVATTIAPGETTIPEVPTGEAVTPAEIPIEIAGIPTWIIGLIVIVIVIIVGIVWKFKPEKKTPPALKTF